MTLAVSACSALVAIAGLVVKLEVDDVALLAGLDLRYSPPAGDAVTQLVAHLRQLPRPAASTPAAIQLVFRDQTLHVVAPAYHGFVDVRRGLAELNFYSQQPAADVEYFLRLIYALLAFEAGGMLLHAAGVVRDGQAYLFFGHSGSGKTTVARLSAPDLVLNDDLLLLLPGPERWVAHATPFWNPTQVPPSGARSAPIAALFRLVQDRQVYLEELGPAQALAELTAGVPIIPGDPQRASQLLSRGRRLLGCAPARRLHFLPDPSFWRAVEAGIVQHPI